VSDNEKTNMNTVRRRPTALGDEYTLFSQKIDN
jgi:hypothetical protein